MTCAQEAPKPDVVLIVIDALRQDRIHAYGGPRKCSPRIDELASKGAVFEDAWAPAPWTLPSVASLMTGMSPRSHGATIAAESPFNVDVQPVTGIASEVPTLAERLTAAGYRCEATVSNAYLDNGVPRGFEAWSMRADDGSDLAELAAQRLTVRDDRPRFLYLHFMETHDPILVSEENFLDIAEPGEAARIPDFRTRSFASAEEFDSQQFRAERLLAYDGAIRYVDRQVGKVVDAVQRAARPRPTIFIVTSDHGEEVHDHREAQIAHRRFDPRGVVGVGHGHTLYPEVLRVPLIVSGAGVPAKRIRAQASLLDVAPTVLDLLGLWTPALGLDGRSLLTDMRGGETAPRRGIAASHIAYGFQKRAWITPRWHLILSSSPNEPIELFDRQADPRGLVNLANERPEVVKELSEELENEEARTASRMGQRWRIQDLELERLRAVGYTGTRRK